MATASKKNALRVLERCRVGPPPDAVSRTALPLTFFDVLWLQVPPVQRLHFYHFPNADTTTLLPNLKNSLSLALQIFYPLAGNLIHSPETNHYEILYTESDSVNLTIAESDSDFHYLTGCHRRDVTDFHPLVPYLPGSDSLPAPVLALQLTHFPNSGFCIGISFLHAAADGWITTLFMKSWASIFRTGDPSSIDPLPTYDRTVTSGLDWITRSHLQELEKVRVDQSLEAVSVATRPQAVRATFVLSRARIERLRNWVLSWRAEKDSPRVSTYLLTCAYVWACLAKVRGDVDGEKMAHFIFAVDCRALLDPPLPAAYFGNCIGACFAEAKVSELTREDGFVAAIHLFEKAIRACKGDAVLRGAESWMRRILEWTSERAISVVASPRFGVYDTDFGWGRPRKVEIISAEGAGGMALVESRDEEGGVEIGLTMPDTEMDRFDSVFEEGLKCLT